MFSLSKYEQKKKNKKKTRKRHDWRATKRISFCRDRHTCSCFVVFVSPLLLLVHPMAQWPLCVVGRVWRVSSEMMFSHSGIDAYDVFSLFLLLFFFRLYNYRFGDSSDCVVSQCFAFYYYIFCAWFVHSGPTPAAAAVSIAQIKPV